MGNEKGHPSIQSTLNYKREELLKGLDLRFPGSFVQIPQGLTILQIPQTLTNLQIPQRLTNFLKSHLKNYSLKDERETATVSPHTTVEAADDLDKQLKPWRENPTWVDQDPQVEATTKGFTCNVNAKVKIGLPPDAVYNILTDPENRRVFQNIKEVISRKVVVDEGFRQVVEVEQTAMWTFLLWSGTIAVDLSVDQNRQDHSVKFKHLKTGFMRRLEGCWTAEPLFIDEQLCFPFKPKTLEDYNRCTGGKGRVASILSLEQVIKPAILPPPLSWYLAGISARNTEVAISALAAEAARLRGGNDVSSANNYTLQSPKISEDPSHQDPVSDIYIGEPPSS